MGPYKLGKKSLTNLNECVEPLVYSAHGAIKIIDFTIVTGKRDEQEQNRLFDRGLTQVKWPNSFHNTTEENPLSRAFDFYPWVNGQPLTGHPDQIKFMQTKHPDKPISEIERIVYMHFAAVAYSLITIGNTMCHTLIWGGDWNGDDNFFNQNFYDLPHIQFIK